jgi:hypothetical protein
VTGSSPLSPADDLPVHQVAEPIRRVGTTDRHFYDRFYFNLHGSDDALFVAMGFANYPNLGVADAFVVANADDAHRVVRASRELGLDRLDTSVGPIHFEVVEGLQTIRVRVEPNEWGIAMDATWQAAFPPQLEPPHVVRRAERLVTSTARFTHTGCWSGWLELDGRRHELTPDRWRGGRDRSWGVRPVGDPEPPGIAATLPFHGHMHHWAPMQFDDVEVLYFVMEDGTGARSLEEAVMVWPEADGREPLDLGRPEHDITFAPGTTRVTGGTIDFPHAPGGARRATFEVLRDLHLGVGTGYLGDDGWRHGKWQGPLVVDGVVHDLATEDGRARMVGVVDALARFTLDDGRVGCGVFEYSLAPPIPRYGFGARPS